MFIQTKIILADLISERAPLPWQEAVDIFSRLGQVLKKMHQQGIIAGHLHPAKIYLDTDMQVYVSSLQEAEGAFPPEETWRPAMVYQSPEQLPHSIIRSILSGCHFFMK